MYCFFMFRWMPCVKRDSIDSRTLRFAQYKDPVRKICRRDVCFNTCFALILSMLAGNMRAHTMFCF